jgi:CheY-like chemotaxis protein
MTRDAPCPSRSLMVVDDDHDLVDAVCEWVRLGSDWRAVAAYGSADAIAQATVAAPDAILLDMEMAGADGFETAQQLAAVSGARHSALLAYTGNPRLRDAAALDARFSASILKPADPNDLLALLEDLSPAH